MDSTKEILKDKKITYRYYLQLHRLFTSIKPPISTVAVSFSIEHEIYTKDNPFGRAGF